MSPDSFASSIESESLSWLLYLYLWPFWMFKDVNQGNLLEQAAAYRYNRERRVYLPGYILKWSLIFSLLLGVVFGIEALGSAGVMLPFASSLLAGATGVCASGAFVVTVQITVVYFFLCRWRY
ncbi:hypothetical protein [Chitinimonas koreensis]|uniref:hypothetical protein n=1 Tax=Chitinimonas koreensis TaxID=356302 RepID=UPI0003FE71A3|nr:hypothetical protein [Chitinimonas koreensis]QNM95286.1 hypothetical protein H9L41_15560 [Chitinimonas koreensis]